MKVYLNGWVAGHGVDQERFIAEVGPHRMLPYQDIRDNVYRVAENFNYWMRNENVSSRGSRRRLG